MSVPLPARQREHLAGALEGVRTTRPDQWHVTLAFLPDHDDAERLGDRLAEVVAQHRPVRLRVEGGGTFPHVVWAGLSGDVGTLQELARGVVRACDEAGAAVDRKPFRPHVTVARHGDAERLVGYAGPAWTVEAVDLVHSVLGRSAEHRVLRQLRMSP